MRYWRDPEEVAEPPVEQVGQPPAASEVVAVPPSPEELARRQALVETILREREHRRIVPLTSADLVYQARQETGLADC